MSQCRIPELLQCCTASSTWRNSPCSTSSNMEHPCQNESKEVPRPLWALHHQQEVVAELKPIQELNNTVQPSGYLVQQLHLQGRAGAVGLREDPHAISEAEAVPGVWKPSASPPCSEPSTDLTAALPPGVLAASTLPGHGLSRPPHPGFCRWPQSLTSSP